MRDRPQNLQSGRAGQRVPFVDLDFDRMTLAEAAAWIAARPPAAPFAYVVTPNVDHIVRLESEPAESPLRAAYRDAALCLCDSRILQRLARWCGIDLPLAAGSDLTARLLADHVGAGDRICIVGGSGATIAALAARLPGVDIVHHEPPMGLRHKPAAMAQAAQAAAAAKARLTFLAVGSPQQELLARAIAAEPGAVGTGLCIGASIEFIVGERRRAPRWMQRASLEWAFRLIDEPRRMWRRYLVDGPRIFAIVRTWRARRRAMP